MLIQSRIMNRLGHCTSGRIRYVGYRLEHFRKRRNDSLQGTAARRRSREQHWSDRERREHGRTSGQPLLPAFICTPFIATLFLSKQHGVRWRSSLLVEEAKNMSAILIKRTIEGLFIPASAAVFSLEMTCIASFARSHRICTSATTWDSKVHRRKLMQA